MAACDMPGPLRHVKVPLTLDEHAGWMGYGRISSMQILEQSDPAILLFSVGAARVLGTLVLCKSTSSTIFLEVLFFGVFFFNDKFIFLFVSADFALLLWEPPPTNTPKSTETSKHTSFTKTAFFKGGPHPTAPDYEICTTSSTNCTLLVTRAVSLKCRSCFSFKLSHLIYLVFVVAVNSSELCAPTIL